MVACAKQENTGVKRNLHPAHHEVVLNPNICSAMALMRCCPGRDVQAPALSATAIFSQAVSFPLTFSTTGDCWVLRGSCQCSGAARRQLWPHQLLAALQHTLQSSLNFPFQSCFRCVCLQAKESSQRHLLPSVVPGTACAHTAVGFLPALTRVGTRRTLTAPLPHRHLPRGVTGRRPVPART